ncbi:hypothetical protein BDN70DRAFT_883831 [Pholiota conissans]|uniref:Uncharacterized protein n=1 Tax=Pholiota conissans TaxID=109636 RepID=A0A9P5YVI7_9AGAR|nr:hypothetical protein BDN70DRAFT_883831 [Pholiota conissans]
MIVKTSNFSDSSSESSSFLSPPSSILEFDVEMSYDELRRHVSRIRTNHSTGKDVEYPALSTDTMDEWVSKFEDDLEVRFVPRSQWANAAIIFLAGAGKLSIAMRRCRAVRFKLGIQDWPWEEFKADLYDTLVDLENEPSCLQKFQQEHPNIVTAAKVTAGTGLVIAGTSVLAPSLAVATLNGIGFTAGGVAGGSFAAAIQSVFYGGATTGLFSACQSIGATAAVASGSAITSSIGAVAIGTSILRFGNDKGDCNSKPGHDDTSTNIAPPPYQP